MKISLNWVNDYVDTKDINTDLLIEMLKANEPKVKAVVQLNEDIIFEFDEICCHYEAANTIGAIIGRDTNNIEYVNESYLKYSSSTLLGNEVSRGKRYLSYSAIRIENINFEPSPDHLSNRLINCGIRPTNLIEDLAKYIELDIGQKVNINLKFGIMLVEAAVTNGELKSTALSVVAVCRYVRLLQEYMPEARVSSALYDSISA
ncbi:phenylalanine--tRNA ligase beta subunit-related protein [Clostridium swellfunianum]|uniref:phenylalanine--tRNA ligase beta subunit-related protein n=1 Tax=Clostridium swellfunianum TaxID=1367462 RepID=UPI0020301D33|nr:phenylalanine--tRNA ligase beta subunit-related protein [Clostridium swellfunianum]MCM0649322.1 phenylalanine--tRNA ligase beta subunit-related protein [Clostridium swellfunianum]